MSSTNRSDARDSHVADYYVTPQKPIADFMEKFMSNNGISSSIRVLDPCAGGDSKNEMSYPAVLNRLGFSNISTIDIRTDSRAESKRNFLILDETNSYDIVITNPPFAIAQQIIEKALQVCKPGGYVVMLLRLNYIGSQARQEFWTENPPYEIYAHNRRMSFTADNKTDSIEYAHFVRKKGVKTENAKFYILKS